MGNQDRARVRDLVARKRGQARGSCLRVGEKNVQAIKRMGEEDPVAC
jgi:hypothetical protein